MEIERGKLKFLIQTFGKKLGMERSVDPKAYTKTTELLQCIEKLNPLTHSTHIMHQTHSAVVKTVTTNTPVNIIQYHQSDGLVSHDKNIALCIIHSDCTPVVLFDHTNYITAATHAGWKGAKAGIVTNTIKQMLAKGVNCKNIEAVILPCIQQESYEVDADLFKSFIVDDVDNKQFFSPSTIEHKYYFNLPAYVKQQLRRNQIHNIIDLGIDTYNSKEFFSYRYSNHHNLPHGSNISVISATDI